MAIFLPRSNTLFLHIPKTGGSWLKQAIYRAGIPFSDFYEQHIPMHRLLQYEDKDYLSKKFIFSIVRHPATWYQSRWCFRMKHGWHVEHPLDRNCSSNDFRQFVRNVIDYKPDGWLTYLYAMYNDGGIIPNRVCRTENLVNDVVEVFKEVGEPFDENAFRNTSRVNDSEMDGKPSKYWAKYSPELLVELLAVEHCAISKYYPDFEIDPEKFCGDLPYD